MLIKKQDAFRANLKKMEYKFITKKSIWGDQEVESIVPVGDAKVVESDGIFIRIRDNVFVPLENVKNRLGLTMLKFKAKYAKKAPKVCVSDNPFDNLYIDDIEPISNDVQGGFISTKQLKIIQYIPREKYYYPSDYSLAVESKGEKDMR